MTNIPFPKLKYQGVPVEPGTPHTENPGYIYRRVENPEDESALEGEWFDSPSDAVKAFKPHKQNAPATASEEPGIFDKPQHTEEWPTEKEKRRR